MVVVLTAKSVTRFTADLKLRSCVNRICFFLSCSLKTTSSEYLNTYCIMYNCCSSLNFSKSHRLLRIFFNVFKQLYPLLVFKMFGFAVFSVFFLHFWTFISYPKSKCHLKYNHFTNIFKYESKILLTDKFT